MNRKSLHPVGAFATTNTQKYRHVKYTCLILAYLYPLAAKLFLFITEVLKTQPAIRHQKFMSIFWYSRNGGRKVLWGVGFKCVGMRCLYMR